MDKGTEMYYRELAESYYGHLKGTDIIEMCRPMLQNKGYQMRHCDGRIELINPRQAWDGPWWHTKLTYNRDCITWHKVLFTVVSQGSGKAFAPSDCQKCFKVVVRPKTLQQLFALKDLMKRLDLPSKCGVELRPRVNGLYGGYFYNWGLVDGLKCYKRIKEEIDKDSILAPALEPEDSKKDGSVVLLKRA